MSRNHPTFLKLVVNSEKKSEGSNTGSSDCPAFKTSDCREAGMTPRVFQDWTVCAGTPRRDAIGRTPPNLPIIRSTGVMDELCTQCELEVNSFCGLTSVNNPPHYAYMPKQVGKQLKALRKQAGLTVRAVAEEMEIPHTTYANYENRYKKPYLPKEFCQKLAPVLINHGIGKDAVNDLCGVIPYRPLTPDEDELLSEYAFLPSDTKAFVREHVKKLAEAARAASELTAQASG